MKVTNENEGLKIEGLSTEETELILDGLVRLVNITLKEKVSDEATTEEEKISLNQARRTARRLYNAISNEHSKIPQI